MCTLEILTAYYLTEINQKSLNNKSRVMHPESYAIRVNFKTFDFMDFRLYGLSTLQILQTLRLNFPLLFS